MIYRYLTSVFADQNASPRTICASKKKNKHTQIILDCLLKEEVYVALVKSSAHTHTERKDILKLQKGFILVPCLILESLASLFRSHRLCRHHCCYGSQSDPKHCKFIFSGKYLRMLICFPLKYMLEIYTY